MTTMIREVYEALKEAGASEEKAIKAALAHAQIDFPRAHDLLRLARLLPRAGALDVSTEGLDSLRTGRLRAATRTRSPNPPGLTRRRRWPRGSASSNCSPAA
jgi:HEPN domain-containing protein